MAHARQFQSNFRVTKAFYKLVVGSCFALTLQACAAVEAAVTVVATGVKVIAKAVGPLPMRLSLATTD